MDYDADEYFASPEEAALAQWLRCSQAKARIVSVEYDDDDHAVVLTDTVPSHPMWNYFEGTARGWVWTADHN